MGPTFEVKVEKSILTAYICIYGVKSLRLIGFWCRRIFPTGGKGFEDFILTRNHFASYKGVNRFRRNFLMDLKEEEPIAEGIRKGRKKKEKKMSAKRGITI